MSDMKEAAKVEDVIVDEFDGDFIDQERGAVGPPTSVKVSKNFDFGEGDVVLEADNYEQLMNLALRAKDEATQRKLFEMQPQAPVTPLEIPQSYDAIEPPTNDELSALMLNFNNDPLGSMQMLMEWSFGMPLEAIQAGIAASENVQSMIYGDAVGRDFVARHESEYYPCAENANKLQKFLETQNLAPTPQNYDYAFNNMKAVNALKQFPKDYFEEPGQPVKKRVSTALSGQDSSYSADDGSAEQAAQEAEKEARQMPLDQLRARLQANTRR